MCLDVLTCLIIHPMRRMQFPGGFPWLNGDKKRKVNAGNALAVIACRLFKIAIAAGARAIFEQPPSVLASTASPTRNRRNERTMVSKTDKKCWCETMLYPPVLCVSACVLSERKAMLDIYVCDRVSF